jgi:hypothetical protein
MLTRADRFNGATGLKGTRRNRIGKPRLDKLRVFR